MEVIVIESEAFEQLKVEIKLYIKQALKELLEEKNLADNTDWITIAEAMKLLPYKLLIIMRLKELSYFIVGRK